MIRIARSNVEALIPEMRAVRALLALAIPTLIGAALCVYPAALIGFGVVRSIMVRVSARQAVQRLEQPAREQRVKALAP